MCQQTGSGIWRKGDILMQRSAARSPNRIRRTKGEVVFDTVNYIVLSLLGIITLYPIINVLAISLSSYTGYLQNPAMILPAEFNLDAYKTILSNPLIMSSYSNTITVALLGTVINVVLTVVTAYPLAKEKVRGSRALMFGIVFTMMFSGGIIPVSYTHLDVYKRQEASPCGISAGCAAVWGDRGKSGFDYGLRKGCDTA